jgi:hypothetical protein
MDIAQSERRLRHAFEMLGETAFDRLRAGLELTAADPACQELLNRIIYYQNELVRLRAELHAASEDAH